MKAGRRELAGLCLSGTHSICVPDCAIVFRNAAILRAPRLCRSLFLLQEAQIADNGEQPLSDGRFGVAGKIEESIKFILVRLQLG